MSDKFNPKDHLRTLTRRRKVKNAKGQEQWVEENHMYLDVKYRILWFRQVYPEGFIQTTELEVTDKYARIEATVYDRDPKDGGKRMAVSRRQISASDFKDYVEKCETQAIGRSLAVAGFGTQFCDDLDEDDAVADSPVDGNNNAGKNISNTSKPLQGEEPKTKAAEPQNQAKPQTNQFDANQIYKIASRKGLTKEDTNTLLHVKFKHSDAKQLTAEQIKEFIAGIKETPKDRLHSFLSKYRATMAEQHDSVA